MKGEDFAAWLSAITGLSAKQRREALQALEAASETERAPETGDEARRSAKKGGRRGPRKDTLGMTSHERVAAQAAGPPAACGFNQRANSSQVNPSKSK